MSILNIIGVLSKNRNGSAGPVLDPLKIPMLVMSGESNSGGRGLNTDATSDELTERAQIQIFGNVSFTFENLHVGVNNLLGHAGFESLKFLEHSWELELANKAVAGTLPNPTYLVKTGQGGTVIANWAVDADVYSGVLCWPTFKDRVDAAITLRNDHTAVNKFAMLYSQGINDAILGTDLATWKAATIAHFAKIRARYGATTPIVMTKLMDAYATFNVAIAEICDELQYTFFVATTGLALRDDNHWTYASQKTICDRMITKLTDEGYTF